MSEYYVVYANFMNECYLKTTEFMSESKLFISRTSRCKEAVSGVGTDVGVEGEFHNFSKSASSVTIISK